jgi:hypothetical protein
VDTQPGSRLEIKIKLFCPPVLVDSWLPLPFLPSPNQPPPPSSLSYCITNRAADGAALHCRPHSPSGRSAAIQRIPYRLNCASKRVSTDHALTTCAAPRFHTRSSFDNRKLSTASPLSSVIHSLGLPLPSGTHTHSHSLTPL